MVDNNFVTDMKTKANIFNAVFAKRYTPLKNNTVLFLHQVFLILSRSFSLDFIKDEILKIIKVLSIHKVHGHDSIYIRMIKI